MKSLFSLPFVLLGSIFCASAQNNIPISTPENNNIENNNIEAEKPEQTSFLSENEPAELGIIFPTMNFSAFGGFTASDAIKPRILISTDIGGTDPDDNQSMTHLLMYNDRFDIEGLVSSPSFGSGSKAHLLRMIDLYEKDYYMLSRKINGLISADSLRGLCKQGRIGSVTLAGYSTPTEGSEWIVKCASKKSDRPLWVLVWGGLEDLAQALHDAPQIAGNIKVYWIGGPNKKWGVNSYVYIMKHFPDLWMIENNASYRGFIADASKADNYNNGFYNRYIRDAGVLGIDFENYYNGLPKMGDTPSLLYMMNGDPNNPLKDSWGGSFEKAKFSPLQVIDRNLTSADTFAIYSVMEFISNGPQTNISPDSACVTLTVDGQDWKGYSIGNGKYMVRYSPKSPAMLTYRITSTIDGFEEQLGSFTVSDEWPGKPSPTDLKTGKNHYTDRHERSLYAGGWQGAATVAKWRNTVMKDWEKRWSYLKNKK